MNRYNKTLGTSNFFSTDTIGITLILVVSFVLRFYHFNQIPFNSDELSAIYRARFDTFSELINKGVLIDGHPAGVQVFLYYWIKCFGTSEFVVKLPFMIMGILSVYITYRIAQKWFNSTVALITSAYVSTLQFTIMFSQIARPYSSGLFLALLTVWFWTNFIFNNDTKKINCYLAGFIISGALSAYNHHFNLLFLLIVCITGLFFINKLKLKLYLLGGIAIFVLYIPHLHIFFYQLKVGGVGGKDGWLAAPEYSFLYEYLKFIFHYSKLEIIFTFIITLAGIALFFKSIKTFDKTKIKFIIISFVWFLLPLLIGFYYSRMVAPVLQYSVMIFTFPFLLIGMFSFFPELGKYLKIGLISFILYINIYTLTIERKYYKLFYHQGYRECAWQIKEIYKQTHKNIPVLVNGYGDFFMGYYEKLFNTKFNCVHFNIDTVNALKFNKLVKAQISDELILAAVVGTPSYYCDIIKETYPYLIKKSLGYGYEMFYFSKQFSKEQDRKYIVINNPRIKLENKKVIQNLKALNYVLDDDHSFYFNKDIEYDANYITPIFKIISNKYNNLHVSFNYYPKDTIANPLLVISTEDTHGKSINWQGIPLKTLLTSDSLSQKIYYSVGLVNFNLKNKDTILKIFIWNKDKDTFAIDDVNIWTEEGNRYVYSLYYDFK
ncbi:MAG: glycosyltransferase family 39 protein [Bacteroidota bacterium]